MQGSSSDEIDHEAPRNLVGYELGRNHPHYGMSHEEICEYEEQRERDITEIVRRVENNQPYSSEEDEILPAEETGVAVGKGYN